MEKQGLGTNVVCQIGLVVRDTEKSINLADTNPTSDSS